MAMADPSPVRPSRHFSTDEPRTRTCSKSANPADYWPDDEPRTGASVLTVTDRLGLILMLLVGEHAETRFPSEAAPPPNGGPLLLQARCAILRLATQDHCDALKEKAEPGQVRLRHATYGAGPPLRTWTGGLDTPPRSRGENPPHTHTSPSRDSPLIQNPRSIGKVGTLVTKRCAFEKTLRSNAS